MDTATAEGEIYDHLYRFFERYYDNGDFLSKRYYARESASKAAPYAVPYDGSEVYLHWANKDQYYIKTSEYFTDFTFDLSKAKEVEGQIDPLFAHQASPPMRVHFRIVDATEGEHGNIKAANGQKRYFILHEDDPVSLENDDLIIRFEYRPDPKKTGQDAVWQRKRIEQAVDELLKRLNGMKGAGEFARLLSIPAPTEKQKDRTLLAKYLARYTARNTMDYFIHKDLGGFLQRELDFYIKNEIMRLDDIENDEAPRVEQYLSKIKVLRKIARKIIAFLAQLEDFQKKLWLKKKFVTETHYCITLDRVPEELYPEIAANEAQHDEWVRLLAIDEIKGDLHSPAYSKPLSVDFLKAYQNLVVDTKFFRGEFRDKLISTQVELDENFNGLLINSDNFQSLTLIRDRYTRQIKSIFIDPPYNTGNDEFQYKDDFQHSSWLSLMHQTISSSYHMLFSESAFFATIDNIEGHRFRELLNSTFGNSNFIATIAWQKLYTVKNSANYLSTMFDYIHLYAFDKPSWRPNLIPRSNEQDEVYGNIDNDPNGPWISNALQARNFYSKGKYTIKCPGGRLISGPPEGTYWRLSEEKLLEGGSER
jgi:adenine-specific DNA-methyltransferase